MDPMGYFVVFHDITTYHDATATVNYSPGPGSSAPALVNAMLNSLVLRFQFSVLRTGSQKKK